MFYPKNHTIGWIWSIIFTRVIIIYMFFLSFYESLSFTRVVILRDLLSFYESYGHFELLSSYGVYCWVKGVKIIWWIHLFGKRR